MSDDPFAGRSAPVIHLFRGHRVVLDAEVAALFGVETRRLNEQVRRNADRFGEDFAVQLTPGETADFISQSATSSAHGGRRKALLAFTEHGTVMAATLLRSDRAVAASRFMCGPSLPGAMPSRSGGKGRIFPRLRCRSAPKSAPGWQRSSTARWVRA